MAETTGGGATYIDPLIGTRLGDFVIEALLGKGAMGRVYRARQISLNRPVALKVMRPEFVAEGDMVARFRREARAAGAISHPHLVQIYSFGEEGDTCYFAMELVEGCSLKEYLKRGERFSESECLEIGRQVLSGLREAHRAGIVHRDIKPDNLMLDRDRRVKVADLGLARMAGPDSGLAATMTGLMMGTPLYIAPEQAEGLREVDYRADFYSLGATLYHLATGKPPYEGASGIEVIGKHLHAPVPDARAANPELSKPFAEMIRRLMAKKPADRPQKHAEIEREFDRCGAQLAEEANEISRIAASAVLKVVGRSMWDEPATWIAAAAVTAVLVGGVFLYARFSKGPDADEVLGMVEAGKGTPAATTVPSAAKAAAISDNAPRASDLPSATKEKPFDNSLGMKFVPIPGTKVLFCIWETRVKDFEAFVRESGYSWSQKPPFEQGPDHPVVMVNYADANAFCAWLGKREGREYRLPTDEEWDAAAGTAKYPWGDQWPPPEGAENIAGEESRLGMKDDPKDGGLPGYRDAHPRTAPVGSYRASKAGLYDMGGNVRQWVEDWYTEAIYQKHRAGGGYELGPDLIDDVKKGDVRRVARGGLWFSSGPGNFVSSSRHPFILNARSFDLGFRCVLVVPSHAPAMVEAAPVVAATPAPRGQAAAVLSSATKEQPFVNSLGMKFVPIPGTKVLFCVWETRVRDFAAFVKDSGYVCYWKTERFDQTPDDPVVNILWKDAKAFCAWLGKKEGFEYRLPTDDEWDVAVGKDKYPWGNEWPPPAGADNIAGEEAVLGDSGDPGGVKKGYRDGHPRTAPVGSYGANRAGLYDMGGNVRELLEDWYTVAAYKKHIESGVREFAPELLADITKGNALHIGRGGNWQFTATSAFRMGIQENAAHDALGFRCVVVASSP